jgi:hypothetical protein
LNLLFANVAGIFRYSAHVKEILEKLPSAKQGKVRTGEPIDVPQPPPVTDQDGNVHVDLETVINPKVSELGRPVWSVEAIPTPEPDVPAHIAAAAKIAKAAEIGAHIAHQLRHTLATQAINRGMSLEAIAALLGHRSLRMTLVYARIADRTVANEYFAVSEKVEAMYDNPKTLPADAEGAEMVSSAGRWTVACSATVIAPGQWRWTATSNPSASRAASSSPPFIEFKPTLLRQRDDALAKGQVGRQKIFDGLIERLDEDAS